MKFKASSKLSFDIFLAAFLVSLSLLLNQVIVDRVQFLQQVENLFYDLESTVISKTVDSDVVIIAIDDTSINELGRWPWPRSIHARLINQLTDSGVAATAMDILFMEPDQLHPENDLLLAAAMHRNGRVVIPALTSYQEGQKIVVKPVAELAKAAELAHVEMIFDSRGVARQLDLQLIVNEEQFLPSMSLALSNLLSVSDDANDFILHNRVFINYASTVNEVQHVSYVDVLFNKIAQQSLKNKVVFIGVTATGLASHVSTPTSKNHLLMSGVEFQANAFSTYQAGQMVRPLQTEYFVFISLFLIVIPVSLFHLFKPRQALVLAVMFSVVTVLISILFLSQLSLWFTPLPTLLCLMLSYPLWSWQKLEQLGRSLFKENGRANATLDAIVDAVITTDQRGFIEFMNPAAEKLMAYSVHEVRRMQFYEIYHVVDQEELIQRGDHSLAVGKAQLETQVIRNRWGGEFTVNINSNPIYSEKKQAIGMVYAINDLTEISNIHREISFVASHDALTNLPNRVLLLDRLEQATVIASRDSLSFAVLFIDLDGFKKVNDAMGHASGDLLLREVALRLRNTIRKSDTVSRWGGDEFIILVENLALPSDAADIATKIVSALSVPVDIDQQDVFVTPSIGISLYPNDGELADSLLAKADIAMYSVKKNGCNNYCFYSQNLANQAKDRLVLESELRNALEKEEFEIFYQPQVDLLNNQVVGTEALIRWNHPSKGRMAPDQFIPLAEEIGLIVAIGEWVIKAVCLQIRLWKTQGFEPITVAINLSAHQFAQKSLANMISTEISRHDLSPELIQVEITESMMIQDIEQVICTLDDLKAVGVSIAIDDFGTGYSSLEYLKRLPIDKLKIDKSFIESVLHNPDDANIVQAVISLGHNLNMQIIAEGIENIHQADFLQKNNCDFGQGYFYSKPLAARTMGMVLNEV